MKAQETFIHTVNDLHYGSSIRVLPAGNQGWIVISLDSLKLYKYNRCGINEWSKKYHLAGVSYTADMIRTANGGYAILSRILKNVTYGSLVTKLDASGNVLWSKSYGDPSYDHFPYTLNEDAAGNIIVFGNVSHVSNSPLYNMVCKINASGNIVWTNFYNHGGIWGGAIVTSDNGVLVRTGNTFIKTDSNGNVPWTSAIATSGYSYFAPVEVTDGYIFNNHENGTYQIRFFKLDRLSNPLWNGSKSVNYFGAPPSLRKKNNGNFLCVFNKILAGKNITTAIEFDNELNVMNQNSLNYSASFVMTGKDICITDDQTPILAGTASDTSFASSLFYARLNNQFQSGCDTLLPLDVTTGSFTQSFIPTNVISYSLNSSIEPFSNDDFILLQTARCTNSIPRQLNIGTDTTVCPGTTLVLQNLFGDVFESYKWSTGATTSSIAVNQPGYYSLLATYRCGLDTIHDTLLVDFVSFPIPSLVSDTTICNPEPVVLNAELSGATYRWQDESTNPKYYVTIPGDYWVEVFLLNCTKKFNMHISDCEVLTMPNVFTPNEDHSNDFFAPMNIQGIVSGTLSVYNRWGEKIFTTADLSKGWDGSNQKNKFSGGVYYWMINYKNYRQQNKDLKGTVELLPD